MASSRRCYVSQHADFSAPGVWTEEAPRTAAVFEGLRNNFTALIRQDGLNSLEFKVVEKRSLSSHGHALRYSFHYLVGVGWRL